MVKKKIEVEEVNEPVSVVPIVEVKAPNKVTLDFAREDLNFLRDTLNALIDYAKVSRS